MLVPQTPDILGERGVVVEGTRFGTALRAPRKRHEITNPNLATCEQAGRERPTGRGVPPPSLGHKDSTMSGIDWLI